MAAIDTLTWVDGDSITAEKLQAMVQAIRDLRVDIPSIKIQDQRNNSVISNIGNQLKVIAGTTIVKPNPNSQIVRTEVRFAANSFSPGNAPIVIAQLTSTDRVRAFVTVAGPGGGNDDSAPTSIHPSSSGFSFWVAHQVLPPNSEGVPQVLTFSQTQIVHWLAVGY